MELDRHLPNDKIPNSRLVIDRRTMESFGVRDWIVGKIVENPQEPTGGRVVKRLGHDFYDLKIDSHGDNGPIGY